MPPDESTEDDSSPRMTYEPVQRPDSPEEVDAALDRGDASAGVVLIALALDHPNPQEILPGVARALGSTNPGLRHQGVIALAHVARLHHTVDRHCLELLRTYRRGNEADDDLWSFVPHRRLPWWLWRHHLGERVRWLLRDRWHR